MGSLRLKDWFRPLRKEEPVLPYVAASDGAERSAVAATGVITPGEIAWPASPRKLARFLPTEGWRRGR